ALEEYPTRSRGTMGVLSIKVGERNGAVIGAIQVDDSHEIMLITNGGILVRTRVQEVSLIGRNTAGVRLIRTGADELVVGLQRIEESEEEEQLDEALDNDGSTGAFATDDVSDTADTADNADDSTGTEADDSTGTEADDDHIE